ncbi:MAG: alpha/beta hydrolase family protein [Huintestinicola sp.]|uniref:alpha/beta hydrolase family protein n=1 Tax=Huintestinicola sp. TaxID=2981661 RepID=UPI003F0D4C87
MNFTVTETPCKSGENKIFGVLCLPKEHNGKLPVVILSHGYNSSYSHVLDIAQSLAENGFAAYCFDFCGGSAISKSGGVSTDMSIETEISDLKSVIAMISECSFADRERIYLYGESQGGFVSALTAAQMTDRIAGMALLYPAFCIPDNWISEDPEKMTGPVEFMGMKLSRKFREGLPEYDVFEAVSAFKAPVLLLHGDSDRLVDISYSEKLCSVLENCRLEVFENEGHGFSPKARKRMREMTVNYFSKLAF